MLTPPAPDGRPRIRASTSRRPFSQIQRVQRGEAPSRRSTISAATDEPLPRHFGGRKGSLWMKTESEALAAYIDSSMNERELVSSALLETELRRLAIRLEFDQSVVTDLLARVDLVDPPRSLSTRPGSCRALICAAWTPCTFATALRVDCEFFLAYDKRLVDAARAVGLSVRSPS